MIDGPTEILSAIPASPAPAAALRPGRRIRVTLELRQASYGVGEIQAVIPGTDLLVATSQLLDRLIETGQLEVVAVEWQHGNLAVHPETGEAFVHDARDSDSAWPWRRLSDGVWHPAELDDVLVPAKVVPA